MTKRLWDKGEPVDADIHRFTVGDDPTIDLAFVQWDAVASAAHARMLEKIGILTNDECAALLVSLRTIVTESVAARFEIPDELEDCHTAIEAYLVEQTGEAGKKIHTGRSRNDQILVAVRLYLRHEIVQLSRAVASCARAFLRRFDDVGDLPMPGYTHMRRAMPSSVGMWLHAFIESLTELIRDGRALEDAVDSNPLGSASGFGVPLNLDRDYTAELLGFSRVQRSPIDAQNSRGRYELKMLRWCTDIAAVVEKAACDILLYSTEEFGFLTLPDEMTTGSSIMPQKTNPDIVELMRARASQVRARADELAMITAKLPSHYHRDFQYTKAPLIGGVTGTHAVLAMLEHVITGINVNEDRMREAMTSDIYATYEAYRLVREGVPFRDAYRQAAETAKAGSLSADAFAADVMTIQESTLRGVKDVESELAALELALDESGARLDRVVDF